MGASRRKLLAFLTSAVAAAAFTALATAPAGAVEIDDEDAVEIRARVVGDLIIDAQNQVIDLGLLFPGADLTVPADGSGEGETATFLLTAPPQADVDFTVSYEDLESEDTGDSITLGAPETSVVCFRQDHDAGEDEACEREVDSQSGDLDQNETKGGEGTFFIGYRVRVDPGTAAGVYGNESAITLEAEATLQGNPQD